MEVILLAFFDREREFRELINLKCRAPASFHLVRYQYSLVELKFIQVRSHTIPFVEVQITRAVRGSNYKHCKMLTWLGLEDGWTNEWIISIRPNFAASYCILSTYCTSYQCYLKFSIPHYSLR